MKIFHIFKLTLLSALLLSVVACQSLNSSVGEYFDLDTDLQIDFEIDADANPDELDVPSPLFIRMYELKANKMIKKADFIGLFERDKEILGADLIEAHRLKHFRPGDSRTEHFVLDKKTRYVVLYAEFLDFKNARYKVILPVVANNVFRNHVVMRVTGNNLTHDQSLGANTNNFENKDDEGDEGSSAKERAQGKSKKAQESAAKLRDRFNKK